MTTLPPVSAASQTVRSSIDGVHLAAVVLMAGSVRQTELARIAQRSLLDLPMADRTIGDCWAERVEELRSACDRPELPLVVAANVIAGPPRDVSRWRLAAVHMDSEETRGSGGALRDATRGFDPQSHILVAPGHSFLRTPLSPLLELLATSTADVVIHASDSRMPSGFFLIRCGALSGVASNGFADLKEQVLPMLAREGQVRVVESSHGSPMAVRSLDGYIRALRAAADNGSADSDEHPLEDWQSTFTSVEAGAEVDPTARLHDSVVLAGGRVGPGALLVRSMVGPGGIVARGEAVFDRIIGGEKP